MSSLLRLLDRQPRHRVTIDGTFAEAVARDVYSNGSSAKFDPHWLSLSAEDRANLIERAWDILDDAAEAAQETQRDLQRKIGR